MNNLIYQNYQTPKQTFLFEIYSYQNGYKAAIFSWNKDSQLILIDTKYYHITVEEVVYEIQENYGQIENITVKEFNELFNKNKQISE